MQIISELSSVHISASPLVKHVPIQGYKKLAFSWQLLADIWHGWILDFDLEIQREAKSSGKPSLGQFNSHSLSTTYTSLDW